MWDVSFRMRRFTPWSPLPSPAQTAKEVLATTSSGDMQLNQWLPILISTLPGSSWAGNKGWDAPAERAVQQEYFVSWNSLRCADDPPNSWGVTREMSIRKPGPALGEGAACSHGGAEKLLPSAQNHPRGYHWSEKNTSETAHPLIQILLQTGWKFGNYPDVLSHLSRMDSLERNQKLNKWENFIPFLSSDRLSQAESWEFRSVHPRLNMPWEY